jgi:glycosyltransferase involved in cell wall biosynthesis
VEGLAIIIPVLRRPWRIPEVYESAMRATPDANVVFVVSPEDTVTRDALESYCLNHLVTSWHGGDRGDYARKINLGYEHTTEPLIFTGADDIDFHVGWYEAASALIDVPVETLQVMPSGGLLVGPGEIPRIGVVGTVDKCNERTADGSHSTHSLVARWYADQGACVDIDHMIYYPGYFHEYCDDEMVQTAMVRQAYAHCYDAVVEHRHPNRRDIDIADDATYQLGRARSRLSRRVFLQRRRMWAGVGPTNFTRGVRR